MFCLVPYFFRLSDFFCILFDIFFRIYFSIIPSYPGKSSGNTDSSQTIKLISVTKTADNAITFDQGMMSYAATNCSGTSSTVPGSIFAAGRVVFSRSGSTATLAANWGVWTAVNTHPIIWAVKANSKLCQIGDTTPSSLPTAADVEGYANLMIPNGACYTKQ